MLVLRSVLFFFFFIFIILFIVITVIHLTIRYLYLQTSIDETYKLTINVEMRCVSVLSSSGI